MTHDPLCDSLQAECTVETCDALRMGDLCEHFWCQCDLIAKVRADERKQAGARVAERVYWQDGWDTNLVMHRSSAIDAAEGGDGE